MREQVDPFNGEKTRKIFEQELAKCSPKVQEILQASKDSVLRLLNNKKRKILVESGVELPPKPTPVKAPVEVLTPESEYYNQKEIIPGKKGGVKMYFEGYLYTVKVNLRTGRKKIIWECSKKALHHCKGTAVSDESVSISSKCTITTVYSLSVLSSGLTIKKYTCRCTVKLLMVHSMKQAGARWCSS